MSIIIDDDDNDLVVDTKKSSSDLNKEQMKTAIKQGLADTKQICELLEQLSDLLEPFGDNEGIDSLKFLYEEIVPNVLLGKYEGIMDVLRQTLNESDELLEMRLKLQRKEYVEGLMNKYN